MPRLLGVDIPNDKHLVYSLTYVFGIGPSRSKQVCEALSLDPLMAAKELTDEQLGAITGYFEEHYEVEGDLRRRTMMNINRLRDIGCYRGLRGQGTKNNSRTRKGPKKTVAGKKSIKSMK